MTRSYLCPNCANPDYCTRPHIAQEDEARFLERIQIERGQALAQAREAVLMLALSDGKLSRTDVIDAIESVS